MTMTRRHDAPSPEGGADEEALTKECLLREIDRLTADVKRLEKALALCGAAESPGAAQRERQYRSLVESSQDVLLLVWPDGSVWDVMGNTMGILGYTIGEVQEMSWDQRLDLVHPDDRAAMVDWSRASRRWSAAAKTQGRVRDRAGEYRWVDITLSALYDEASANIGHLYVLRDISERVQAQEALIHAEKLSALGEMAGGIAHDFNNILVSILGYADKALDDLNENPAWLRADLERIVAGANDAAEAVRRLQSLYRRVDDTSDLEPVQVDALVVEVLALTEPTWKDDLQARGITIRVQTKLTSPRLVMGNPSELRRVLRNLVTNAVEAMPSGGALTVSTWCDQDTTAIDVTDTGVGLTESQRQHLFQPFYTTKASKGSGLGLTVSQSIVKRHGGEILVTSEPHKGTTFSLRLPVAQPAGEVTPGPVDHELQPASATVKPRQMRVLVVDDEESVRDLLARLLARDGHVVTVVAGGQEAIAAMGSQPFDLVITDLGMPDVTGREVAAHARTGHPEMPIILSTGWGDSITPEQIREMQVNALLAKPFTRRRLAESLAKATEPRT